MRRWVRRSVAIGAVLGTVLALVAIAPSVLGNSDPAAAPAPRLRAMPAGEIRLLRTIAPLPGGGADRRPRTPSCRGFVPGSAETLPIPTHYDHHSRFVGGGAGRDGRGPRAECVRITEHR